jgi:hypothetical protein
MCFCRKPPGFGERSDPLAAVADAPDARQSLGYDNRYLTYPWKNGTAVIPPSDMIRVGLTDQPCQRRPGGM